MTGRKRQSVDETVERRHRLLDAMQTTAAPLLRVLTVLVPEQ